MTVISISHTITADKHTLYAMPWSIDMMVTIRRGIRDGAFGAMLATEQSNQSGRVWLSQVMLPLAWTSRRSYAGSGQCTTVCRR